MFWGRLYKSHFVILGYYVQTNSQINCTYFRSILTIFIYTFFVLPFLFEGPATIVYIFLMLPLLPCVRHVLSILNHFDSILIMYILQYLELVRPKFDIIMSSICLLIDHTNLCSPSHFNYGPVWEFIIKIKVI